MSFSQPYTFSDLQNDIQEIEKSPIKSKYFKKEQLCYTLSGTVCELLTITSPMENENKPKKGVVLTARVHPGETVGSWMLKGAIDFLLSENENAHILRSLYIFKIVPMLNPDGVIQGNYRCSLAGCDLNRRYSCPLMILHPTIFYLKKMVRQFAKTHPLVLYCDFHGHSKKRNVFMYGNTSEINPSNYRLFPFIMSRISPYFSFKSSQFGVQKSKSSTARIAIWKELSVCSIYTIEASFFGTDLKKGDQHFLIEDLMQIGIDMCQSLKIYSEILYPGITQRFKVEVKI